MRSSGNDLENAKMCATVKIDPECSKTLSTLSHTIIVFALSSVSCHVRATKMATFLDPVTRRRVPLNNDIILGILQDGNCSDIDFDEPDEEFIPKTSILDDDLIIKDNDGPSEAPATPSLPPGVPHPKTSVLKRKSIDMYTKANQDSPPASDSNNPLWKVQPIIDAVREGCTKILRTPGSDGLMVDFEIYYGNNPVLTHNLGLGPAVVLRLLQSVPPGSCIFFDRYFTTVPLLEELSKLGYHGTGTIMTNRIPDRQNLCFKDDKRMARGDIEQRVSKDIVLVKWKDTKAVLTASNCTGGTEIELVQRYDKKNKCYIDVDAPKIVTTYNSFMGGVDVLDQSIEYYRSFIKTQKWTLKIILHFVDLAMVNAWFEVAETLLNTPYRDRREASPLHEDPSEPRAGRYRPTTCPSVGKRLDGYEHFPAFDELKAPRTCRYEGCSSRSKIRNSKNKYELTIVSSTIVTQIARSCYGYFRILVYTGCPERVSGICFRAIFGTGRLKGAGRGLWRPPFCAVLVTMEQYSGTYRAFCVRAYYRNGNSIVTAQRLYRAEYRTRHAPSDDSIRKWIRMFENTGATVRIQNSGRPVQFAMKRQLQKLRLRFVKIRLYPYESEAKR
ncbi:PiggyBac transposable element-derived protein 3 [Eumeta japonica]|uniref:PiggyBac transposable element-derived protein 3 n=1 Tax=Eumeta variegata TaxID=151549 RepID=A0A4C1UCJ9_EUMVA|nr:PiggyBac transposable element-derived protein 3 [Eumeta japonica]